MTLTAEAPTTGPSTAAHTAARKRRKRTESLAGYAFLSPWLLGFVLLTAGPMIASLYLAFTNYNLFAPPEWIGLENFTRLFNDPNGTSRRGRSLSPTSCWGPRSSCSPHWPWRCC